MIFKFFMAQWNFPANKDEWTEQVRKDLEEFKMEEELEWIGSRSKLTFKNIVKIQARELAFDWLMKKKESHTKMTNLSYSTLEMQEYFKDSKITVVQAKILFRVRTRMEQFGENFKGGRDTKPCPVCEASKDTHSHSFQCSVIKENIEVNGNYLEIFNFKVGKKLATTVENIVKFRENYKEN